MAGLSILWASACASGGGAPVHPPILAAPPEPPTQPVPVEGTDFAVFRGDGTPADLGTLVAEAGEVEAVLWGEQHDDLLGHGVQTRLLARLYGAWAGTGPSPHPPAAGVDPAPVAEPRTLVLSLEMFERDVQTIVDEYAAGLITEDHFLASARPWPEYEVRYRPAVEFALAHGLPVVAANAPRRYVNRASRLGAESLEALSPGALAHLPPLPYPGASPDYRAEWDALMGDATAHMAGSPLDAQTLWDATMGWSIAQALDEREDALVLHLAGSFHVQNGTGTPEALLHYRPGTRVLTVVAEPAADLDRLPAEHEGLGDFVILTRRR